MYIRKGIKTLFSKSIRRKANIVILDLGETFWDYKIDINSKNNTTELFWYKGGIWLSCMSSNVINTWLTDVYIDCLPKQE